MSDVSMIDQAEGLRRLVGGGSLAIELLWGGTVAQRLRWLRHRLAQLWRDGREPVVLDASLGDLARGLGLTARIDLSQVMDHHARADEAVRALDPVGVFLPAARALDDVARGRRSQASLIDCLRSLPSVPDRALLVCGAVPAATLLAWTDDTARLVLVLDGQSNTQMNAYALIKAVKATHATLPLALVGTDTASMKAARQLAATAQEFLGLDVTIQELA